MTEDEIAQDYLFESCLNFVNASGSPFAVGYRPTSVVLGDVNNDGNLDMVSANFYSANLSVLLGHGNGAFAPQQTFAAGNGPFSVALGDVNDDGNLDMVAANFASANLSVLLGHGNGTFAPQQTFAAGGVLLSSVVLGDVNNDGNLDMVSVNSGFDSRKLSVLLGYGNGTFAPQQTFAVGVRPTSVVLGDVNNDGNLDLVSANLDGDNLSVLLGHGNGTFATRQTFAVGANPFSVALGDVNNDGNLDLVSANQGSDNLSVLLGHGNGTFAAQRTFAAGIWPASVALGDANNDGNLDLVSANENSDNLSVLLGHGNGTFAPQQTFAVGANPYSVSLGDVNNDGNLDLVAANLNSSNLSVLLATPSRNSTAPSSSLSGGALALLISAPIGGLLILALIFGLQMYKRYRNNYYSDEMQDKDIPMLPVTKSNYCMLESLEAIESGYEPRDDKETIVKSDLDLKRSDEQTSSDEFAKYQLFFKRVGEDKQSITTQSTNSDEDESRRCVIS